MREVLDFDHETLRVVETTLLSPGEACPLFLQPAGSADKAAASEEVRAEHHVYLWLAAKGLMTLPEMQTASREASDVALKARSIFGGMRAGVSPDSRSIRGVVLVPVGWASMTLDIVPWTPES